MFFTVLCFVFLVASIRTNLVLVFILFTIVLGLGLVTGAFWNVALGNMAVASRCQVVSPPCPFGAVYCFSAIGVDDAINRAAALAYLQPA